MLKVFSFVLSIVFFILSILNPAFYPPLSSFISEYLAFLSFLFLLPLFSKYQIYIPKISLFFLSILIIPVIQYSFGQIIYFDKTVLAVIYLFSFWLVILIGFNSAKHYKSSLDYFYLVIIGCGVVSSLLAVAQWLNVQMSIDWVMAASSRPVANMAQPNHLATFLLIGLVGCGYFYENKKTNNKLLLIISLLMLSVIALTQSRTAWVSLLFISIYWIITYKKNILVLSTKKIIMFFGYFIGSAILLPIFKESILKDETVTISDRASSGYERIQIWQQAIEAIRQQPLWGYGWNQSSFAQYDTIQYGYIKRYLTSFHNILLDVIIWCGIPIGITIILFCTFIIIKALIKSTSATQICLIISICVILIHALLEFPLSYSYFLLPLGFMLGVLFFTFEAKTITMNGIYSILIFILGIGFSTYIVREYSHIPDNMVAAEMHELNERKTAIVFPYPFHFFDTFESRARWIGLYPCTELNGSKIEKIKYMVKTYMIYYDLYKFSQVLYFNGHKEDAQKHLDILNYMYEKDIKLNELQCQNA